VGIGPYCQNVTRACRRTLPGYSATSPVFRNLHKAQNRMRTLPVWWRRPSQLHPQLGNPEAWSPTVAISWPVSS